MSIWAQLYIYQYSIPLVGLRGIRTSLFNNTLLPISIWTRLYLCQYLIPLTMMGKACELVSNINVNPNMTFTLSVFFVT